MNQLYDTLAARPIEELRLLARKSGLTPHHKAKPETLARQIVEATAPKPQRVTAPKREREVLDVHSEGDVREMLAGFDKLALKFPGDGTFIMSCRGTEESIHMSSKESIIRKKAQIISRGALKPVTMNMDGATIMRAG